MKNLESFDEIPKILREPVFEKAFDIAEFVRMSPKMQDAYFASRKAYLDNVNTFNYDLEQAEEKGHAAGHAAGRAEGKAEEKAEIIRNMKAIGVPTPVIAQVTGLTEAEINNLH